ncbi:unnamed protein product [Urochloa humidicola]
MVTTTGHEDQLAILSYASDCLPSRDQVLDVKVFNISERAQSSSGCLLLTPSSQLSWFGFSDNGQLSLYDSKVMPKPVLTLLELSFPIASSDLGVNSLENEFMMSKLHLSQIQNKMDEMVALGLHTTAYADEAFNMEAGLDRCILSLISCCCSGDKLIRATELAKLLTLEKSMKGAH